MLHIAPFGLDGDAAVELQDAGHPLPAGIAHRHFRIAGEGDPLRATHQFDPATRPGSDLAAIRHDVAPLQRRPVPMLELQHLTAQALGDPVLGQGRRADRREDERGQKGRLAEMHGSYLQIGLLPVLEAISQLEPLTG